MLSPGEQAVEVLRESETTVALTGAGISKSAGIPTFRDLDDGLWRDEENLRWAHRAAFDADPEKWYVKFWELYRTIRAARPTPAHYALRDMVDASAIDTVVTQNIDGLDMLAGTDDSDVLEVHGHDRLLSCTDVDNCNYFIRTEDWLLGNDQTGLPRCLRDDKPLKPDVLLFDDASVPLGLIRNFVEGELTIKKADALLVVGTTLEIGAWDQAVHNFAVNDEKPVIVVNPHESRADQYARFIIRAGADTAVPAIRDRVIDFN